MAQATVTKQSITTLGTALGLAGTVAAMVWWFADYTQTQRELFQERWNSIELRVSERWNEIDRRLLIIDGKVTPNSNGVASLQAAITKLTQELEAQRHAFDLLLAKNPELKR